MQRIKVSELGIKSATTSKFKIRNLIIEKKKSF